MPSKFKLDRQAEKGQVPVSLANQIHPAGSNTVELPHKEAKTTAPALQSITETTREDLANEERQRRPEVARNLDTNTDTTQVPPDYTFSEREQTVQEKVQRYEAFVEDTLRAKLREIAVCDPQHPQVLPMLL
jgi:hypothetical protein